MNNLAMHTLERITVFCTVGLVFLYRAHAQASTDSSDNTSTWTVNAPVPTTTVPDNSSEGVVFLTVDPPTWIIDYYQPDQQNELDTEYWISLLNYSALPDDDATKEFIMSYSSELQRRILATQLSYCPLEALCSYGLDNSTYGHYHSCCLPCSCEQECVRYGNCCPDAKADPELFFDVDEPLACLPLHLREDDTMSPYAYEAYGIAECPDNAAYPDSRKCAQNYRYAYGDITFADILPVWRNTSGTLYRNIHCALCNGVSYNELDVFKPEIGCYTSPTGSIQTDTELIDYVLTTGNCDIGFTSTIAEIDYCDFSISQCNVTGLWLEYDQDIETACKMYTSIVKLGFKRYKNVFCAFCNGYVDITRTCSYGQNAPAIPFSFSGLLALSPSDGNHVTGSSSQCEPGFIYHQNMDECVRVRCASQLRMVGSGCVPLVETVSDFRYSAVLRLTPSARHTTAEAIRMADHIGRALKDYLVKTLVEMPFFLYICSANMMIKMNAPCDEIGIHELYYTYLEQYVISLNFHIMEEHRHTSIVAALSEVTRIDISNITGIQDETMDVKIVNGYENDFSLGLQRLSQFYDNWDNNLTSPQYNPMAHSFCGSYGDHVLALTSPPVSIIDYCYSEDEVYTAVSSFIQCPMIRISNESDPWVVNDDGVLFTRSGHVFNHTQFYFSDYSTLLLCKDKFLKLMAITVALNFSFSMEHIVSIVCSSLSIFSLIITLVAFSVLTQLRTLPGKNNMALVLSLLLAQVFYLVGSFSGLEQGSVACKLVGLLTHFFWLLVVFWMNVCTFHMFHVLTKTKVMSRGAGSKKYIIYHVLCAVSSTIFVGINILVSSVTSGYANIGYGVDSCYVSSQKMLLYTFGIPLALVIVSNLGMFIFVIITIKKASAVQKNVKNERNDIAVFARLSTLTGLTWVFGFVYMWTRLVVFSYIFIILNASQGVFLCVSFICTRRVITIAGQRYSERSRSQKSSLGRTLSTISEAV